MHQSTPRRRAHVRRFAAVVGLLVAVAMVIPGQAAPDSAAANLPGAEDLPPALDRAQDGGTITTSQGAGVSASKMYLELGPDDPIWAVIYLFEHNWPYDNPTLTRPTCKVPGSTEGDPIPDSCVPDPFFQPECATDDPDTQAKSFYFRSAVRPFAPLAGGGADVGVLADFPVNLVAFGSIPATATVAMRVPRENGEAGDLRAHVWERTSAPFKDGCAPLPEGTPPLTALVEGQVEIFLSDLMIDGASVDLGPACRTETPVDLYLWGDQRFGLYFPQSGGPLAAEDGVHPGSRGPLDNPQYLEDNGRVIPASSGVDIPPFTGCGANGEDLSGIVTAMASGPDNPVRATQGRVNYFTGLDFPLDDFTRCDYNGDCPLPGPEAPPRPDLN